MDPIINDELFRVRPIDSEIASLAASLGPDIIAPTPIPSETNGPSRDRAATVAGVSDQGALARFRRFMVLISLAVLFVTSATPVLFITQVTSIYSIVGDTGGEDVYLWLLIANSIAAAAIAPAAGAISDLIGRRSIALLGSALVIVGMIIVGTANRMPVAIGGMALAGVGGAFAEIIGLSGIAELVPVNRRGLYLGTAFTILLPFGACSVYAQKYSTSATWRWGAWIPVILSGLNFVLLITFYRSPPRSNPNGFNKKNILKHIDFIGVILSISGIALFLLGIQWGGYNYPWRSVHVITTTTIGLFLIILFCVWERIAPHPMLPSVVYTQKRTAALTLFITMLAGVVSSSITEVWGLECLQIFGPDEGRVARLLVPSAFSILIGVILGNWTISLFRGANRELFLVSSAMMTAGAGALAAVNQNTASLGMGLSFLGGLGIGGIVKPAATILMIVSPDEVLGTVSALTISARTIGSVIGSTLFFNVLQNKLNGALPVNIGGAVAEAGLTMNETTSFPGDFLSRNSTAIVQFSPTVLLSADLNNVDSYVQGFRMVFLVSIAFGGAAVIASIFLGNMKKHMNDRVFVDTH